MINLELTEKEFEIVRLAVASCIAKLALHDTEALTTLIEKFITQLKKEKAALTAKIEEERATHDRRRQDDRDH